MGNMLRNPDQQGFALANVCVFDNVFRIDQINPKVRKVLFLDTWDLFKQDKISLRLDIEGRKVQLGTTKVRGCSTKRRGAELLDHTGEGLILINYNR